MEGPHSGEFGGRTYEQTLKDLPTNEWVHLEIFLRESASFDGQIIVWQDGVEILRQDNVKTRYPYMGDEWSIASYAGSISPSPATIYFDDATIAHGACGPRHAQRLSAYRVAQRPGRGDYQPATSRHRRPMI